jgi:primosomal protein N' (replication factor Y)
MVLLNRRGWSNFLSCRSCGRVWSCPDCDVALVLHRAEGNVACHHCGHREPAPARCGDCGSTAVARHGAGTERVQHELAATLDDGSFPIFRLDADIAGAGGEKDGVGEVLRSFEQAPSGVLIGTQMVAKGHDFRDVTLGVVLDADATLRFPDFRAEERTFALIAQLAGRVGRGGEGRVLVQSIAPEARAIEHAARHDSDGFLVGELQRREALRYPPFSHLIRIVCSSVDPAPARAAADALRARICASLSESFSDGADRTVDGQARQGRKGPPAPRGVLSTRATEDAASRRPADVLGPADLFRLRGRERQVLVVKASERRPVVHAVGEAVRRVASAREHAGVSFSVDVDPQ